MFQGLLYLIVWRLRLWATYQPRCEVSRAGFPLFFSEKEYLISFILLSTLLMSLPRQSTCILQWQLKNTDDNPISCS